jgi:hypothetical protein
MCPYRDITVGSRRLFRMTSSKHISIREATTSTDTAFIISCFDSALPYLVSIGSEGQWGTELFSERKWFRDEIGGFVEGDRDLEKGIAWIADVEDENDGETRPAGAIVLTTTGHQAPQSVSPPVKELYVKFLITDRRLEAVSKGVGSCLLDFAKDFTRKQDIKLLRVDCWSGGNGGLVKYVPSVILFVALTSTLDIMKIRGLFVTNSSDIQINTALTVIGLAGYSRCGCRSRSCLTNGEQTLAGPAVSCSRCPCQSNIDNCTSIPNRFKKAKTEGSCLLLVCQYLLTIASCDYTY